MTPAEQHAAAAQLMARVGNSQAVRSQIAAALSGGYDFADALHNIYLDFGYPAQLTFTNYWNMYRRFGIARRGVEVFPDYTWADVPTVDAPPPFLRELETLVSRHKLWQRLRALDVRQRVGRYAGLFMRVRDGKAPSAPLAGKLGGAGALVELVPLYESQLRVVSTENNPTAENYGQPTMYEFSGSADGGRNEHNATSFQIHPSRVVIAAEGADDGSIYGISSLEAPYNSLMDLRKVLGGGGEGFYKNAAQNIVFELQDPASARTNKDLLDRFNENYDDFAANRQRRAMWTPGLKPTTLSSSLISPKDFAHNSLLDVAAGFNAPLALLVGNQEGKLAGEQDTAAFLRQVQSRRLGFADTMVESVLAWCVKWGVLPSAQFALEWPDATESSDSERLGNADKMADTNQKQYQSGGLPVYTAEEIRAQAGYDEQPGGDVPDETLDDGANE